MAAFVSKANYSWPLLPIFGLPLVRKGFSLTFILLRL
jgi:hypothetical protein